MLSRAQMLKDALRSLKRSYFKKEGIQDGTEKSKEVQVRPR